MDFQNPIPVAVALVPLDTGAQPALLGIIRARAPGKDGIALPGGYVDKGESVEHAVARELREETGIETDPSDWRVQLTRITEENRLLVFCELKHTFPASVVASCVVNPEVSGFCTIDDQTELVFPIHQTVAREHLRAA